MNPHNTSSRIVFFSKMAQAVPAIGPAQTEAGGTFVTNRSGTLDFFRRNYPKCRAIKYHSPLPNLWPAGRALKNARVIVTGAGHRKILDRYTAPRAMLFHGTYRNLTPKHVRELAPFDHVFLLGPRMERMLNRCEFSFTYSVTGYAPFSEFPDATTEHREKTLAKLGLASDQPTILYAPARRSCGSWVELAESIAGDIPPGYNLIMRPHPIQVFNAKPDEKRLYDRVTNILRDRGNAVIDLADYPFPEVMSIADLLIADGTSPNEEFMFYNRPQIITETYPREKWRKEYEEQGMHPDDVEELMGLYDYVASWRQNRQKGWPRLIEDCLANPDAGADLRRQYFTSAFGKNPRGAAIRVAEELHHFLDRA